MKIKIESGNIVMKPETEEEQTAMQIINGLVCDGEVFAWGIIEWSEDKLIIEIEDQTK